MDDLELIRSFRSQVEPADSQQTTRARGRLTGEFRQPPPRRGRFRPAFVALAVPAAVLVGAVLVVVGSFGGGGTPIADAAILHHASAVFAPRPHMIFHAAVAGDGFSSETWQMTSPPYSSVGSKGPVGIANGAESISGSSVQWWDPRTNTIHQQQAPTPGMPFDNQLVDARAALRAGRARVLGTATVDGRPVYKIQFTGKDGSDSARELVAYVDQQTYRPLMLDSPQRNGKVIHLRVTAFEYLPATEANMKLLSLTALHPDAPVVLDGSSYTSTGTGDKG
jgi:hypothetical protein